MTELAKPPIDLLTASVPQIQAALDAGEVSSRELVLAYLARIEAYDQNGPCLNAISAVNERALETADELDLERSRLGARSPLHGIPIVVKDNYETVDLQTAAGSLALKGWRPSNDASIVKRLRRAGAIILAKANMHEFALGITTQGSLFGATRNPYALDRNPGGSSGGTAAAIAAGFAPLGWGTDTCGSISIPAAHNHLFGLRGTQGLLSRSGIVPLSTTQDIGGPMARTVTDIAIALDATVGYDPTDRQTVLSFGQIPTSYTAYLDKNGLDGARVGMLVDLFQHQPEDREVAEIVRGAIATFVTQGAECVEVSIPNLYGLLSDRFRGFLVVDYEFKAALNGYLTSRPTAPVRSFDEIIAMNVVHSSVEPNLNRFHTLDVNDISEYQSHLLKRTQLKMAIYEAMLKANVDVLVYPSIRQIAAPLGEKQPSGSNAKLSANSGLPVMTMPAGFNEQSLPVGIDMLGREWSESQLLSFAYAYECGLMQNQERRLPTSAPAL